MNKPSAFLPSFILAGLAMVFCCCGPVSAATVVVKPGDSLARLAHVNKVPLKALAEINGLEPSEPLKPGTVLTLPAQAGKHAEILPPETSAREIITEKPMSDVKGLNAAPQSGTAAKGKAMLMPEMRPAVDALTPGSAIAREPKTYDRTSPGITATLHPGSNTEILGVFNLPGSTVTSARPYGLPENAPQVSPSGGVMLKRTF